jgi:hypothetical protein
MGRREEAIERGALLPIPSKKKISLEEFVGIKKLH